jgi:hypothetical protein
MRKTIFFFVLFHRRAMQAWILFLVSIEPGTSRPVYHRRPWLSDTSQLGVFAVGCLRALAEARVGVVGPEARKRWDGNQGSPLLREQPRNRSHIEVA